MDKEWNEEKQRYEATKEKMVAIIEGLVPTHPEILTLETTWGLLNIAEFRDQCRDIAPSLAQAAAALVIVKAKYAEGKS